MSCRHRARFAIHSTFQLDMDLLRIFVRCPPTFNSSQSYRTTPLQIPCKASLKSFISVEMAVKTILFFFRADNEFVMFLYSVYSFQAITIFCCWSAVKQLHTRVQASFYFCVPCYWISFITLLCLCCCTCFICLCCVWKLNRNVGLTFLTAVILLRSTQPFIPLGSINRVPG